MKIWRYKIDATLWHPTGVDFFILPTVMVYHKNFTFAWLKCFVNFMNL